MPKPNMLSWISETGAVSGAKSRVWNTAEKLLQSLPSGISSSPKATPYGEAEATGVFSKKLSGLGFAGMANDVTVPRYDLANTTMMSRSNMTDVTAPTYEREITTSGLTRLSNLPTSKVDMRHKMTDFGSPYRGLIASGETLTSMMGKAGELIGDVQSVALRSMDSSSQIKNVPGMEWNNNPGFVPLQAMAADNTASIGPRVDASGWKAQRRANRPRRTTVSSPGARPSVTQTGQPFKPGPAELGARDIFGGMSGGGAAIGASLIGMGLVGGALTGGTISYGTGGGFLQGAAAGTAVGAGMAFGMPMGRRALSAASKAHWNEGTKAVYDATSFMDTAAGRGALWGGGAMLGGFALGGHRSRRRGFNSQRGSMVGR